MRSQHEHIKIIEGIELIHQMLPTEKQWQNSYIKLQIEERNKGRRFSLKDHVKAMIYSMLSAETPWERIEANTGTIDALFMDYDPEKLLKADPVVIVDNLQKIKCGGRCRSNQMKALARNIITLKKFEETFGGIDIFYNQMLISENKTHPYERLILTLSMDGEYKLAQMGIPLVAEYLRNVGYNISKPDRHVMRMLDSGHLAEHSFKQNIDETWSAPALLEGLRIIRQYAEDTQLSEAYIDHLLWSYCANGYGQICTKKNPQCLQCKVKDFCQKSAL